MNDLHQLELQAIQWLSQFRTPISDDFFRFMNFFDRGEFYILLFPLIWYGFSRTWGIRIFYWMMASSIINYYFKITFGQPRPFDIDGALAVLTVKNFGFPSGAAQSTFILAATLIKTQRSSYKIWIFGIAYLALVCYSRVYLGVHFPSDILGGLSIGIGLFYVFWKYSLTIEKWISKYSPWQQLAVIAPLCVAGHFFFQQHFLAQQFAALAGVSIGLILCRFFKIPNVTPSIVHGAFAAISIVGIYLVAQNQFLVNYAFILGLWLSLGLPSCFKYFKNTILSRIKT